MKTWRVGTFSMGALLILLGIMLFISQWQGFEITQIFFSWWPLICIVLGTEILVYIVIHKKENSPLKYDFLSIFFVGMLGMAAFLFTIIHVSGLLPEVKHVIASEEKTFDLPAVREKVSPSIDRIVLEVGNQPMTIESSSENDIQVFGTYRTTMPQETDEIIRDRSDYISIHQSGNTVYVKLKELPRRVGPVSMHTVLDAKVIIPENVALEVRGNHSFIDVYPGLLASQWTIQKAGYVNVYLQNDSDVKVKTLPSYPVYVENDGSAESVPNLEENQSPIQTGEGTYELQIIQADQVQVYEPLSTS